VSKTTDSSLDAAIEDKLRACRGIIKGLGSVVVAFSGGADSTLVLALALQELGKDRVLAVRATSPIHPQRERQTALATAEQLGAELLEVESDEYRQPFFIENPPRRCYFCKDRLLGRLDQIARERGLAAVVTGTNADDTGDFRPGHAALEEHGARSPLLEANLGKDEIRAAAKAMGIPTWNSPSAACLASRIPYGQRITPEKLQRIEQAENALQDLGFTHCRVRDHETIARIEVPQEQVPRAAELRDAIVEAVKPLGYAYVALDLQGLRSGSLNEVLDRPGESADKPAED